MREMAARRDGSDGRWQRMEMAVKVEGKFPSSQKE